MKVKFFANFREATGESEIEIKPEGNIGILIEQLVDKFGEELKNQLYESKKRKIRKSVNILVNDRQIDLDGELEKKLSDNDVIKIFPPVSGG